MKDREGPRSLRRKCWLLTEIGNREKRLKGKKRRLGQVSCTEGPVRHSSDYHVIGCLGLKAKEVLWVLDRDFGASVVAHAYHLNTSGG